MTFLGHLTPAGTLVAAGALAVTVAATAVTATTPWKTSADTQAGPSGEAGQTGDAGRAGLAGAPGASGEAGVRGRTGLSGAEGESGEPGATGLTGAAGATGPAGAMGARGLPGAKGDTGETGATGDTGARGPAGQGGVGAVYTVPARDNGGYLQLSTPGDDYDLILTCNYGFPGDNETFWFANQSTHTASVVETFDGGGVDGVYAFPSVSYGQGGTNRVNPTSWPYHATFTIQEDDTTLTRWDVTTTGSTGGACTFFVYQSGDGSVTVRTP